MNKNQLYDIENELYRKLDTIKAEQKQYNAGVEKGIDMTISAIRKELGEENQPNNEEQPNNCIYCTFKDGCGDYFPNADEFRLVHCDEDDSYTISASQNKTFLIADINYCPICGRSLRGGIKPNDP